MDQSYTNSFGQFGAGFPSSNNGGASVGGVNSGNVNGVGSIASGGNDSIVPVVPSGGDIILAPSNTGKKKRRWLVVVAIVLFVVAVGAGVGAWIINQSIGNDESILVLFDKFANNLLYGKDSSVSELGDFSVDTEYTIEIELSELNGREKKYFDRLNSSFEHFSVKFDENSKDFDDEEKATIELYIAKYKEFEQIVEIKSSNTPVGSNYADGVLNKYANAHDLYLWLNGDLLEKMSENGCVEGGKISERCLENSEPNDEYISLNIMLSQNYGIMSSIEENYVSFLVEECWSVNNILISTGENDA